MKTLFVALVLTVVPGLALAMGCSTHETATTCPTGQVWNSDTQACVDLSA